MRAYTVSYTHLDVYKRQLGHHLRDRHRQPRRRYNEQQNVKLVCSIKDRHALFINDIGQRDFKQCTNHLGYRVCNQQDRCV